MGGGTHEDGIARQLGCVVSVRRLGQLGHDEVADVDNIVDRVEAESFEPRLQPEWRRADGDVFEDQHAEARAERVIGDLQA